MRFQLKTQDGAPVQASNSVLALYTNDVTPKKGDSFTMPDGRTYIVDGGPTAYQFLFGPGGTEVRATVTVSKVEK